jgi:hypothetical protein
MRRSLFVEILKCYDSEFLQYFKHRHQEKEQLDGQKSDFSFHELPENLQTAWRPSYKAFVEPLNQWKAESKEWKAANNIWSGKSHYTRGGVLNGASFAEARLNRITEALTESNDYYTQMTAVRDDHGENIAAQYIRVIQISRGRGQEACELDSKSEGNLDLTIDWGKTKGLGEPVVANTAVVMNGTSLMGETITVKNSELTE